MSVRAGERARQLRAVPAPQGLGPANFLVAEAGTQLCVIHVDDDGWSGCFAFEQRQEDHVRARATCILEEPIVPLLTDQDLAELADLPDVRSSGSDEAEQNQWNDMLKLFVAGCSIDVWPHTVRTGYGRTLREEHGFTMSAS